MPLLSLSSYSHKLVINMSQVFAIPSLLTLPTEVTLKILRDLDPGDAVVCSLVRQPNSFKRTVSNRRIYLCRSVSTFDR